MRFGKSLDPDRNRKRRIRAQGLLEQSVGNAISKRMSPADAVKDAHDKIVQLFEEGGIMQP